MNGRIYTEAAPIKARLDELLAMLRRQNEGLEFELTWIENEGGWISLIHEGKRVTVYSTVVIANGRQIVLCWPKDQIEYVKGELCKSNP